MLVKSKSDNREYKFMTLNNKLRVILIRDEEADKSAACMDVSVGAGKDPKTFEGIAHFLEHMLFMGSKKYPKEDEYSTYISKNGGYDNAYTGLDNTNYHFECANKALEGALDRFA